MYLLGSTADEYLSNALESIAKNLKISETISAITLLALGNGAPDIFASFSAAGSSEGIYLSLSSSMGGVLFIIAIVTSIVIFTAGDNQVTTDKSVFYRNILFLITAILLLLFSGVIRRRIDLATCALLIFIYIVYIAFVVVHDNKEEAMKAKRAWMFNELKETSFKKMNRSEFLNLMDDENAYFQNINPSGEISGTSSVIYEGEEIKPEEMLHFSIESANESNNHKQNGNMDKLVDGLKETAWANAKHVVFQNNTTNASKYKSMSFIEFLASYIPLRRMTIPMTKREEWNRNLDSCTPFMSVLFFLLVSGLFNPFSPIQIIILSSALCVSVIIRFNTYASEPPGSPVPGMMVFQAFIMSIVWIWTLANIVVDLITIYGDILGVSPSILAATLLAIGNCVGDAMASFSIAKKGYGGMAMMGCFACPLFNFLIGLSLSSSRLLLFAPEDPNESLLTRSIKFDLLSSKATVVLFGALTILCILALFIILVPRNKFKFSSKQAIVRLSAYGCFILGLVYLLFT